MYIRDLLYHSFCIDVIHSLSSVFPYALHINVMHIKLSIHGGGEMHVLSVEAKNKN